MTTIPLRTTGSFALVGGLHLVGWGVLLAVVVPLGIALGHGGGAPLVTVGIGLTAYALGLRHAFDPDHIAAIDSTTRRLVERGRPARSVGLWFSLGHSSIVVALCVLLVLFGRTIAASVTDGGSTVHVWTGIVGPVVSGVFLLAIAGVNLIGLRPGGATQPSGPVTWLLRRFDVVVDRPSRMYVVGLLFGLGFDTATEIGLLVLAGTAVAGTVPWWAILTLPILFAAGMSMFDGAQGVLARRAYAWEPDRPNPDRANPDRGSLGRRYSVVMTVLSVVVAGIVGVVELAGVVSGTFGITGALAWIGGLGISWLGVALTGILIGVWATVFVLSRRDPSGRAEPPDRSRTEEGIRCT